MYPIDVVAFLKRAEENDGPRSQAERELWKLIVNLQNQAYAAGLRDARKKQKEENDG